MPPSDTKPELLVAVTGSDHPYIYDLPHVLSLPPGFEFRFRYRGNWVGEQIRKQIESGNSLSGCRLILLYHSRDARKLLPLRECEVVALEALGPVLYLRFKVGAFPNWASLQAASPELADWEDAEESRGSCRDSNYQRRSDCSACRQREMITRLVAECVGVNREELAEPLPSGKYLLSLQESKLDAAEHWLKNEAPLKNASSWAHAVDLLSHDEKELWGIPLFYLLGFQKSTGDYLEPRQLKGQFSDKSQLGFRLVADERYRLRLVEWRRDRPTHDLLRIACLFSEEVLALEGSWDLVVGKYDVPEFSFRARSPGYSEVYVKTERLGSRPQPVAEGAEGDRREKEWPSIYSARVPVEVRHNYQRLAVRMLALVAGLAFFALPQTGFMESANKINSALLQLVGLLFVYWASGELVYRFTRMGTGVSKLPMPTRPGDDAT